MFSRFPSILAVILFVTSLASAHQDPMGDVHPEVRVEKGNFAIYFRSNDERTGVEDPPQLRMVYSPEGKLLSPRHYAPKDVREIDKQRSSAGRINESDGKPSYTLTVQGREEQHRLPWPEGVRISILHGSILGEHAVILAAKTGSDSLSFYHYSRDHFRLPSVVAIGSPVKIYDFPIASNIVYAGERYWIAWVRAKENQLGFESILTSWRPGDVRASEIVLEGPADWNEHLSMQAHGNVLCLAYHCSINGAYPGRSRIITVFHRF